MRITSLNILLHPFGQPDRKWTHAPTVLRSQRPRFIERPTKHIVFNRATHSCWCAPSRYKTLFSDGIIIWNAISAHHAARKRFNVKNYAETNLIFCSFWRKNWYFCKSYHVFVIILTARWPRTRVIAYTFSDSNNWFILNSTWRQIFQVKIHIPDAVY